MVNKCTRVELGSGDVFDGTGKNSTYPHTLLDNTHTNKTEFSIAYVLIACITFIEIIIGTV